MRAFQNGRFAGDDSNLFQCLLRVSVFQSPTCALAEKVRFGLRVAGREALAFRGFPV